VTLSSLFHLAFALFIVFDLFAIVVVTTGGSSLVLRVQRAGTGHGQHHHRQAHTIQFFALCFKEQSKFYLSGAMQWQPYSLPVWLRESRDFILFLLCLKAAILLSIL
jgi:hypothetical protein